MENTQTAIPAAVFLRSCTDFLTLNPPMALRKLHLHHSSKICRVSSCLQPSLSSTGLDAIKSFTNGVEKYFKLYVQLSEFSCLVSQKADTDLITQNRINSNVHLAAAATKDRSKGHWDVTLEQSLPHPPGPTSIPLPRAAPCSKGISCGAARNWQFC